MIRNRIVTRGFNKSGKNLLVSRGFIRGFFEKAQEAVIRVIRMRAKPEYVRHKYDCDEFKIRASIVRVNEEDLVRPISNVVRVVICPNPSLFVRITGEIRTRFIEAMKTILIRARIARWKR